MSRILPLIVVVMIVAGCSGAGADAAAIPAAPDPPEGWTVLGSVSATTADDGASADFFLAQRPVALHVACRGAGSVIVLVGGFGAAPGTGSAAQAATFQCGTDAASMVIGRIELAGVPAPDDMVTVFMARGDGTLNTVPGAANVSVEQPVS